jgi:hypothetical protein
VILESMPQLHKGVIRESRVVTDFDE